MTAEQAYKYGFLLRCAEEGLDDAGAEARAKRAVLEWVPNAALGLGVLSAAGGLAGGIGVRRALQPDFRIKDLQRKEVADLYESFADDLEGKAREDLKETAED